MRTVLALLLFKVGVPTRLFPNLWVMSTGGGTATATNSPAGSLNLTGDGTFAGIGDQNFTATAGRRYQLRFVSSDALNFYQVGTTQGGTNIVASTAAVTGINTINFTASNKNVWVRFTRTDASAGTVTQITCR